MENKLRLFSKKIERGNRGRWQRSQGLFWVGWMGRTLRRRGLNGDLFERRAWNMWPSRGTAVEAEGKAKYKALSLKFPWQVHLTAWGQSGWSKEGGEISRKVGWKSIWGQFWQSLVGHPLLRVWILFWTWGKTIEVSRPRIVGRTRGLKVIWCDWAVKHTLQITKKWVRGAGWRLNMMGFAKKSLAQPESWDLS